MFFLLFAVENAPANPSTTLPAALIVLQNQNLL
jgi:hypothetical protein